jgi:uncharacterized protein (TIGR01777 family)
MSKRVVMPGGSGFLGRALARHLAARGDEVVVLTRGRAGLRNGVEFVHWDAAQLGSWVSALEGADAVVHLTGKRVDCRPTRRNIAALVRSRVEPVRLVGHALRSLARPPGVWVQSATLAIFGDTGDELITEETPVSGVGPQQMVQVAVAWERAFAEATEALDRAVLLRIGVTIGGEDDPATRRLVTLARLGLGGPVAGGRQWLSWIALEDVLAGMTRAIDEPTMRGLYLLTSPAPVRNRDVMAIFRAAAGRRLGLPSPRWLTRLGAPLLGSDAELALTGRRAYPKRLTDEGFRWASTDLAATVNHTFQTEHSPLSSQHEQPTGAVEER